MELGQTTATTPLKSQSGQPQTDAATNSIVSDFDTFLTLLTTQIRNQDPLNPSDSTEFVAQLATFSSVEQQVQTNTLLESLTALTSLQGLGDMASWIGKEVRSVAPVSYQGQSVTLYPEISMVADKADLVITDAQGAEVGRLALPKGAETFAWSGENGKGGRLQEGSYSFKVESFAGEAPLSTTQVSSFQRVNEAQMEGGEPVLLLESGTRLQTSGVLSLRAPL